jgi:hypothetical protein
VLLHGYKCCLRGVASKSAHCTSKCISTPTLQRFNHTLLEYPCVQLVGGLTISINFLFAYVSVARCLLNQNNLDSRCGLLVQGIIFTKIRHPTILGGIVLRSAFVSRATRINHGSVFLRGSAVSNNQRREWRAEHNHFTIPVRIQLCRKYIPEAMG